MKNVNTLLLLLIAFFIGMGVNNMALSGITQSIAVLDVQAVVSKSAQVKALKNDHEKSIKELNKWIAVAKEDVAKQKTDAGKEKLVKKYDADLAKKREKIQSDYNKKLQEIEKSISDTIAQEAKAKGYELVINKASVLYGGVDITGAIQKAVK